MIQRNIIVALSLILSSNIAFAQRIERITDKQGFVYEGYVCEQKPGESISLYSERSEYFFDAKSIKNSTEVLISIDNFSDEARSEFRNIINGKYIQLINLQVGDVLYENLVKMTPNIYVSFYPRICTINWDQVESIERLEEYSHTNRLNDVLTLKTGERYVGNVFKQNMGKDVTIKTLEDSLEYTIQSSEILSASLEIKQDEEGSFFDHSLFLDRIWINNKPVDGIIVSRLYGKSIKIVKQSEKIPLTYNMSEISLYQKTINPDFKQKKIPLDTAKVIKVNGLDVEPSLLKKVSNIPSYELPENAYKAHLKDTLEIKLINYSVGETVDVMNFRQFKYKKENIVLIGGLRRPYKVIKQDDSLPKMERKILFVCKEKGVYYIELEENTKGLFVIVE